MSQSADLYFLVDCPLIIRSPLVYWSRPPMMFSSVVFPQPDCPRIDTSSLSRNAMETPFRACTVSLPVT